MDPSVFVLQPYAVVATMVSVLVAAIAWFAFRARGCSHEVSKAKGKCCEQPGSRYQETQSNNSAVEPRV
jgi:hypothetical protein